MTRTAISPRLATRTLDIDLPIELPSWWAMAVVCGRCRAVEVDGVGRPAGVAIMTAGGAPTGHREREPGRGPVWWRLARAPPGWRQCRRRWDCPGTAPRWARLPGW